MKVRIFDDEGHEQTFANASRIHETKLIEEVTSVLERAEEEAVAGNHVVGFVSYEAAPAFDDALVTSDAGVLPLAWFAVFESPEDSAHAQAEMVGAGKGIDLSPTISEAAYESALSTIKQRLRDGDTYQVNFTHQLMGDISIDAGQAFSQLISSQPSQYAAFIETQAFCLCSVSPELFFRRRGTHIAMAPMKGTRRRGVTPSEDDAQLQDLRCSAKDRAENLMIVDMIRNDLGRIAAAGSVNVDQLFQIIKLPTVWQQLSRVSAKTDASLVDLFKALFPCASVTGAPKAKTMEIIRDLESGPRGVYTGTIGWIRPGGDARFNVSIRTLVIDNTTGRASYGVGGGIVWDSDPEAEWQECIAKSAVLGQVRPSFELLETLRYEPGQGIMLKDRHLSRLAASADYFDFEFDERQINDTLDEIEGQASERIRLLLHADGKTETQRFPLEDSDQVVRLGLAAKPVDSSDPFLYHKTTHREVYESALAEKGDVDDVVLFNERGELTETTIYNLFVEVDGELLTPSVRSGLLAGTLRAQLLSEGRAREQVLYIQDLEDADAIWVGNGVRGLRPAVILIDTN